MTQLVLHNEHRQTAVIPREELRTWVWHRMDDHHYGINIHFKGGDEIDLGPYSFDEAEKVEAQLLDLVEPTVKPLKPGEMGIDDALNPIRDPLRKLVTGEVKTIDDVALQTAPYLGTKISNNELEDFLVKKATGQRENIFDIFFEFTSKLRPLLKMHGANTNVEFSLPPKTFDLLMSQAEGRLSMRDINTHKIRGAGTHLELNGFVVNRR